MNTSRQNTPNGDLVKHLRKWWHETAKPFIDRNRFMIGMLVSPPLLMLGIIVLSPEGNTPDTASISRYFTDVRAQQVKEVVLRNDQKQATVMLKNGQDYLVAYPDDLSAPMFDAANTANVPFKVVGKGWAEQYQVLIWLLIFTAMLLVVAWQANIFALASNKMSTRGENKPFVEPATTPEQKFSDVGGADEVIANVKELVESFRSSGNYRAFGVKPITGLLLKGRPGTGKTLLARAIAGEAGVPFFSMNGADFMGRYLNDGPRAVREVFENLRRQGGGILFIDEFDTIGSKRSSNDDSGSKELNNTVNALLTEMDGFDTAQQVQILVIGATNRAEDLDTGILRRFKMQEDMPTPGPAGRRDILLIRLATMQKVADNLPLTRLVKATSGMTGDDIATVVNQAGLIAIKEAGGDATEAVITFDNLMEALDTKQLGSARRSRVLSESEKRRAAIHEAGHSLAAYFTKGAPRPTRLTIVPRGTSGGHTRVEDEELSILTLEELKARLVFYMGGRAAERLIENVITTGASSDIEQATRIARHMVCDMGMGRYTAQVPADNVDTFAEIDALVKEAEAQATQALEQYRSELNTLTERLLQEETLDGDVLDEMFGGLTAA